MTKYAMKLMLIKVPALGRIWNSEGGQTPPSLTARRPNGTPSRGPRDEPVPRAEKRGKKRNESDGEAGAASSFLSMIKSKEHK